MDLIRLDTRFFSDQLISDANALMPAARQALSDLQAKTCPGAAWTGWFDFPRLHGFSVASEIKKLQKTDDVFFDLVLVIGIGGSYLGTRAVADALTHEYAALLNKPAQGRPLIAYAGHHLSEAGLVEVLDLLEARQPIIHVISKTGTTTEPSVAFRIVRGYMERRYGHEQAARRIIAITDPDQGALRKLAKEQGYRSFPVPPDVGGRFSVLSAVGLVPLAFAGFDIDELLAGADGVFTQLKLKGETPQHSTLETVLKYATCRTAAYNMGKRVEVLNYSNPKLRNFVEWWKQLFGESEGKDGKGIFPTGLASTTDLHSLGQYVQDGCRNLMETFLVVEEERSFDALGVERHLRVPHVSGNVDELGFIENRLISEINSAATMATRVAHSDGGVPCLELRVKRIDEQSLGALFAFFETACAVSGALLGVNPFDQPGVEAYKKNLFGLLGKPGFEALGADLRRRL